MMNMSGSNKKNSLPQFGLWEHTPNLEFLDWNLAHGKYWEVIVAAVVVVVVLMMMMLLIVVITVTLLLYHCAIYDHGQSWLVDETQVKYIDEWVRTKLIKDNRARKLNA